MFSYPSNWQEKLIEEQQKIIDKGYGELKVLTFQKSENTRIIIKSGQWHEFEVRDEKLL